MAVTTTITTTNPHAVVLAAAVGDAMGLTIAGTNTPRSATTAEFNTWLTTFLTNFAQAYQRKTTFAAVVDPTPITPVVS